MYSERAIMLIIPFDGGRLREAKAFDISTLEKLADEHDVKKFYLRGRDPQEYFKDVARWNKPGRNRDYWGFIIEEEGLSKGYLSFVLEDALEQKHSVGIFIGKEYRGYGLMSRALAAGTAYLFEEQGAQSIEARIESTNSASSGAFFTSGFSVAGSAKHDDGTSYDRHVLRR